MDIDWMMMVIPAIDYEDLRRIVWEGGAAQRFCLLSNTGLQRKEQ